MSELSSRIIIATLFIISIYFSIKSRIFYLFWIISLLSSSLWELSYFSKRIPNIITSMLTLQTYTFYLILLHLRREDVLTIIIYNSSSDAFQYFFGKLFGKIKPFSFTNKSIEGYIGGLILPHYLFNFGPIFPILNIIGMIGGMISSRIKRDIKIKHWGGILGSHGGINDRLDSIILPVIFYYFLEY